MNTFQRKYPFPERHDVRQRWSRSVAVLCRCQRRQTRKNKDSAVYVTLCRCVMFTHIDGWQHLSASLFIYVYILKCHMDLVHDWNYNLPLLVATRSCTRHMFSWCKSKMPGLCLKNDSHTSSPESALCLNLLSCVIPGRLSAHLSNCREEEMMCWSWQSVGNLFMVNPPNPPLLSLGWRQLKNFLLPILAG